MSGLELFHGDCLTVLRGLPSDSMDALITDPPAGINYKRLKWDCDQGGRDSWIQWLSGIMQECLRCLKPGAYGLVWAFPRTAHWTAMALENAGFQVRDVVVHLFGDGVPRGRTLDSEGRRRGNWATLKPASEHWILCKKPINGRNIRFNSARYGTGTLNVDKCRVQYGPVTCRAVWNPKGRFPTNVVLSHPQDVCDESQCLCSLSCIGSQETMRFFKAFFSAKSQERERNDKGGYPYHPTVKPLRLMRYLVRLIAPSHGCILDPFMGSGTTGLAAAMECRRFVGIEKDAFYFSMANQRLRTLGNERHPSLD